MKLRCTESLPESIGHPGFGMGIQLKRLLVRIMKMQLFLIKLKRYFPAMIKHLSTLM
jgi:hypothetical protein